ncbi:hypothetical protein [Magnetospira sp. QH-2]|uniref:hypothetical protein n=1 Tax=Magnetospira sp. (strain QH-2) TaxID=1288970 RepID=UPI0003E811F0|nr:hypothetical protein [Magnetospira sp. QH-2]CCQ75284.1 conserved membrane protein of unknown function [Magnetospira sp. QH-2]
MPALATIADSGSRALSALIGTATMGLAVAVWVTADDPDVLAERTVELFGGTFLVLLAGLLFLSLFAWVRMGQSRFDPTARALWLETGLHGASGVATLALTYTLFGISLGIGTLADQPLNPDTVGSIIQDLTRHFSMAFLTTVVGLPTSALLRALLLITEKRLDAKEAL